MRPRSLRFVFTAAASIFASSAVATPAAAGGAVLSPVGLPDPAFVHARIAVAVTPGGSTRWTEITIPAGARVMWLVPVKPGAAVDWASGAWLDALEEATKVRILPPNGTTDCPARLSPEVAGSWTTTGTTRHASGPASLATADAVLAYAADHGYRVPLALADEIAAFYQRGWRLVALELSSSSSTASSDTLRVSDDAGAVLPLALSRGMRITTFMIGPGAASLPGMRDVDATLPAWGPLGTTYEAWRRDVVEKGNGTTWLRESASHDALFDETPVPGAGPARSVAASYFEDTSCTTTARTVRSSTEIVGTSCAPGEALRVPGGVECAPASGPIAPSTLSCFDKTELALALSAATPRSAFVTRFAGSTPKGLLGANLPIAFEPEAARYGPVLRAKSFEACAPPGSGAPLEPPSISRQPASSSSSGGEGDVPEYVTTSDGCSGSTTTSGTVDDEDEPPPEATTSESCSRSTTSTSDDGWDDSDSAEGCSTDDDSSSTQDSCSGGKSSSSSGGSDDDGWDTEDEASPKSTTSTKIKPSAKPKPHTTGKTKKKPSSPISRYSLLAAALLLPLRRRGRATL